MRPKVVFGQPFSLENMSKCLHKKSTKVSLDLVGLTFKYYYHDKNLSEAYIVHHSESAAELA